MVKGLELFRDWFAGFEDCYALIGGAACDLWMGERGLDFRATKDLDIVLAFENERPAFGKKLWAFVKQGGYKGYQAGEALSNFYRFHKPRTAGFPVKLELCARRPFNAPAHLRFIRIPLGQDVSSLSAIILDSDYYDLVLNNGHRVEGVPTVTGSCLIPLKAKAWLNLSANKAAGGQVDMHDLDKHRSDVFRLLLSLAPEEKTTLVNAIRADLRNFIDRLPPGSPAWASIRDSLASNNLTLPSPEEAINRFKALNGLE
jgi:hypothetical protein